MRRPKPILAVLCVVALSWFGIVHGTELAVAAPCAAITAQPGGWRTISSLPPDSPEYMATSPVAIDPRDPNLVYVSRTETPHQSVWRSTDGGCNWVNVFDVTSPIDLVHGRQIDDVAIGSDGTLYVTVNQVSGLFGNYFESLWIGRDSGTKWERVTAGLPVPDGLTANPNIIADFPVSETHLFPAPSDAQSIYLVAEQTGQDAFAIYASKDGGRSWEHRSSNSFGRAPDRYVQDLAADNDRNFYSLAVDPIDPKEIWIGMEQYWGDSNRDREMRLLHSTDGGATATVVNEGPNTPLNAGYSISVFHPAGRPARLVVVPWWESQFLYMSADGGATWNRLGSPFVPIGRVFFGKSPMSMIAVSPDLNTPARVARFHARSNKWLDITPRYVFDQFYGVQFTSFNSAGMMWVGKKPIFYMLVMRGTVELYTGRF